VGRTAVADGHQDGRAFLKAPEVGIADLIRSVRAIAPDDRAEWARIASLLGFTPPQPTEPRRDEAEPGAKESRPRTAPRTVRVDTATTAAEDALPLLEPTQPASSPDHQRWSGVASLEQEVPGSASGPPAIEPLLPHSTAASTLRAMALLPDASGALDDVAVVRLVAARKPLARVPRRRNWRLTLDVAVLEDWGEGMGAFLDDVEQFVASLRDVVGRENVRHGGFLGAPVPSLDDVGIVRGTVVLAITDLGLSVRATPDERGPARWIEFVNAVKAADAFAVMLTPYPVDRWPVWAGDLPIVPWDTTTEVGDVLRVVRARA
jgi:hypothetical protein